MSDINGNNIDNLFKRASEGYPIRTDSSDWDRIAAALEEDPSVIMPLVNGQDGERKKRRWIWLFLLIPLVCGGYLYILYNNNHTPKELAVKNFPTGQTRAAEKDKSQPVTMGSGVGNSSGLAKGTDSSGATTRSGVTTRSRDRGGTDLEVTTGIKEGKGIKEAKGTEVGKGIKEGNGVKEDNRIKKEKRIKESKGIKSGKGIIEDNRIIQEDNRIIKRDHKINEDNASKNEIGNIEDKGIRGAKAQAWVPGIAGMSRVTVERAPVKGAISPDVVVDDRSSVKTADVPALKKTNKKPAQSHMYAGLIIAPDLSTIKFQSVKEVGYTGGILLGYSFKGRLGIETGVYLDTKKYYSDGKYFNKKNVPQLYAADVLTVDGSCNMIEIPVNIRYNLSVGEKMKWFATAGLSTYLMTKDAYDIQYLNNGVPGYGPYPYRTHYHYWFSIVNLSIGYEKKLGKIGVLRLEPYLRIPLSGMGTGSLPIMSAGLNVGITRRIW